MKDWQWLVLLALVVVLLSRKTPTAVLANNDETWEWTDYRGQVRRLTVARHAS